GSAHQVALYLLDWDGSNTRSERVDVIDPSTGNVLSSQTASAFSNGVYLVWDLSGHVQLKVTRLAGNNAVVSGLFFDPPPSTATTTALTSSASNSLPGQAVTFTATVTPVFGGGTPTGTVTFKDGTTSLGTGTLSGGSASLTTSSLALGSHSL